MTRYGPLWVPPFYSFTYHVLTQFIDTVIVLPLLSHCMSFDLLKVVDAVYDCKSEVIGPGFFRFKAEIGKSSLSFLWFFQLNFPVLHVSFYGVVLCTMLTKKGSGCFILFLSFFVGDGDGSGPVAAVGIAYLICYLCGS